MTNLDRVGNSDIFNFRGGGVHRFCMSARSAHRQCGKNVACLHGDGSAIYL